MITKRSPILLISASALALIGLSTVADAAQIEFKSQATPRGPLVVLDDVAVVRADDMRWAQWLGRMELVLAPAAGESRSLRAREVQDLLAARGVNIAEHRFAGANVILVTSDAVGIEPPLIDHRSTAPPDELESLVADAIKKYLSASAGDHRPWGVRFRLTREQQDQLASTAGPIRAEVSSASTTSTAPTTSTTSATSDNRRRFQITASDLTGREMTLAVDAEAFPLAPQVVAVRALPRGVLIREEDVRLDFVEPSASTRWGAVIDEIGEAVGREARQSLAPGQAIEASHIQRPILVRRGEGVQVTVRTGGVQVRTTGSARQEGSYGDLIQVELPEDRSKIYARVTDSGAVEVLAAGARTSDRAR